MKRRKKGSKTFFIAAVVIGTFSAVVGLVLYVWSPPILRDFDQRYSDIRFRIRGEVKPNPQVAIVAIDEKSINELGRWPWSRYTLATLVNGLISYNPKVIAFDVTFSEPESPGADGVLGMALGRNGRVILGYFFRNDTSQEPAPQSLEQVKRSSIRLIRSIGEPRPDPLWRFPHAELNVPQIGEKADGFGFFNVLSDEDGIVRRAQLLIEYKNDIYPSLNLEGIRRFLGGDVLLSLAPYGVEGIYIGKRRIPVDEKGQLLVNYYGPTGTVPTYSVVDVLSGRVPKEGLKDKLVFVGATEIGIYDARATPFSPVFPGVEIHATVAGNILDGRFLIKNNLTRGLDMVLVLIFPLLLAFLLIHAQSTFGGLGIFFVFMSIHALLNYLLFNPLNLLLGFLYPGLSLTLAYVLFEGYRNLVVERRNRYLRMAFSTYVSPELVSAIIQDPDKLKLGGEKRRISVLFSDIRGFTSLSEKIPPETIVTLLNEYLSPMTQIVMGERGTLDKYIGDAIMAIFGAPLDVPDHSRRACQAALYMIEKLEKLNLDWEKKRWPHISIGIGINTGEAIVGNMGANVRFEYTAIGDTVNLASRLEGLNKLYGTDIIVSKSTLDNLDPSEFLFRELDLVQVKGKERPIPIFELVDFYPGNLRKTTLVRFFSDALRLYRDRHFYRAREGFADILRTFPDDKPSRVYFERCTNYIAKPPPPDWNGVYIAVEK
jgi:adenylate cyclase